MVISGRDARALLEASGLSSRHARAALACGLVGRPIRTKGAHLYDEKTVHDLAARPTIDWRTVVDECPAGIFVARREIDVSLSRAQQLDLVSVGWGGVASWEWFAMALQVDANDCLPFVATVAGFVVLGADIVNVRGGSEVVLAPPGPWFRPFENVRLRLGPGRPWVLYLGRVGVGVRR